MLANLGGVDWRPLINFWSVLEYLAKYTAKSGKGTRHLATLFDDVLSDVWTHEEEDGHVDLWRRTILKFYNRILGGRDYALFEVVRYGTQLPPVLSTFGEVQNASLSSWRALRDRRRVAASQDEATVLKPNKSEYFNQRGSLARPSTITEANLRDISFYAFWRQYYYANKRLVRRQKERFFSVSGTGHPGCANRSNPEHEFYARRTLYAYIPRAGLQGLSYIDEVVQVL